MAERTAAPRRTDLICALARVEKAGATSPASMVPAVDLRPANEVNEAIFAARVGLRSELRPPVLAAATDSLTAQRACRSPSPLWPSAHPAGGHPLAPLLRGPCTQPTCARDAAARAQRARRRARAGRFDRTAAASEQVGGSAAGTAPALRRVDRATQSLTSAWRGRLKNSRAAAEEERPHARTSQH